MNLPLFIAKRYLIAKKSHNVINVISAISAIGMAIGTAALIIIMSIYNGFDSLIKSMMGNVEADFVIEPAKGKAFVPEGTVYDWIYEQDIVESMAAYFRNRYSSAMTVNRDWLWQKVLTIYTKARLRYGNISVTVNSNCTKAAFLLQLQERNSPTKWE